jgi:hypothetical protein
MTNDDFEIVGYLPNGAHKLKFTSNEFRGIIFTIGKVSFDDKGEAGTIMNYHYDVLEHSEPFEKDLLDKAVGDLVMHLLEEGVKDNSLVYTGGVDEN